MSFDSITATTRLQRAERQQEQYGHLEGRGRGRGEELLTLNKVGGGEGRGEGGGNTGGVSGKHRLNAATEDGATRDREKSPGVE